MGVTSFPVGRPKRPQKKSRYSEQGGAPLLGVDGVCMIAHGRSNSKSNQERHIRGFQPRSEEHQ